MKKKNESSANNEKSNERKKLYTLKLFNDDIRESLEFNPPKSLLGPLWLVGETAVLFAETGIGKTIAAVQAIHGIANGTKTIFGLVNETSGLKSAYIDYELSTVQRGHRYSDRDKKCFNDFGPNLFLAELNEDDTPNGTNFIDFFYNVLRSMILEDNVKCIVIDNLSYLENELEKGRKALGVIKKIKKLSKELGASILILSHTPKIDMELPIQINHLAGSKMISNFVDSVFAIGTSKKDKDVRYIKHLKARSIQIEHCENNVIVCQKVKSNDNLYFEFKGYDQELALLLSQDQYDLKLRVSKAKELRKKKWSFRKIGDELGVSGAMAKRYIDEY